MDPYKDQASQYLEGGLGFPIPSAYPLEKSPPIKGWTGRHGRTPNHEQVDKWKQSHPDSNILLRLAHDVIGIDVDQYDDKQGLRTLTGIEMMHGELPDTFVSSARPFPSGIRFFRLPSWMDTDKMRDPGEHVEVIRYEHRYAVVPPSWHPGAHAYYEWVGSERPRADELSWLPIDWYVHLTKGCECFEVERSDKRRQMRRIYNRPSGQAGSDEARKDLAQAADALRITGAGSRNNMLSSMAGRFILYDVVLNHVLGSEEVINSLIQAGTDAGLSYEEVERTIMSAAEWATREGEKK